MLLLNGYIKYILNILIYIINQNMSKGSIKINNNVKEGYEPKRIHLIDN